MRTETSRLLKPFITPYLGSNIRICKKSRLLAPVLMAIGILSLALVGLMAATGAYAVAGILSALVVFCA
ncbi:MAG: hypothetical protein JXM71_00885, partial [Spirochaetales bacterium]|nr:hypothetical protein [Spirochaetales bacterium]